MKQHSLELPPIGEMADVVNLQTKRSVGQLPPIDEKLPFSQQVQFLQQQLQLDINIPAASQSSLRPNLPPRDLIVGHGEDYNEIAIPLYKASVNADWKAAKAIFDKERKYVRYSITENGETALHIAASAKRSKQVEFFVKNLVDLMEREDLELQNESFNTALYLAAAAGNVETVKIMMKKNGGLRSIPGAGGKIMPLYAAVLYGNYEVVKYLYEKSRKLGDDGWTAENRGWLLQKCVEGNMFDIALQTVNDRPEFARSELVLGLLARKPDAFCETKSKTIGSAINSVISLIGSRVGHPKNDSEALQLLRIVWENIAKKSKYEIDNILRGPADSNKQEDMPASEEHIQVLELQKLISEHSDAMNVGTQNIIIGDMDLIDQYIKPVKKKYQALKLKKLISEHIIKIHVETRELISRRPDSIWQDNKPISRKVDIALELQKLVFEYIGKMQVETEMITRSGSSEEDKSLQLQRLISKHIEFLRVESQNIIKWSNSMTTTSRILFVAAEVGNTEFLVELIRQYPDLVWNVNDSNQTIFHVAVKNRREGIYNLMHEIGSMKHLITPLKDENGNNMLHLAGKIPNKSRLADVSGAALQMQRELLWFKEVESIIPPYLRDMKNKDGLTPRELFTEEHQDLITKSEKWMKGTASQCMVVATLIATIVFAAAFTVPGGYNQNNGIPIFYRKLTFMVFVVADAMSLFLSSASILTFLSILTSRYAERDFLESLPKKLMLGLVTLFLSITTMMITFSVSFFILYHREMKWIPITIAMFAVMPVLLYILLQYHLLIDVIRSTFGSRYLFKPGKQVLFYENPKV